jgi:glycerate-2-kinase
LYSNLKDTAEDIFKAAISAVDPGVLVQVHADKIRSIYYAGGYKRLLVVGAGKAAAIMAAAMERDLGDIIESGVVITKFGHAEGYNSDRIKLYEAAHPVPDINGLKATEEILKLVGRADGQTILVCLLSGGGSSLLVAPCSGIGLKEKQQVTDALLKAGADINELNTVRKHLSRVKGGRLARTAYPARIVSLIISDVIGDRLDVIASGPTAPDGSTFRDAMDVLDKYSIKQSRGVQDVIEKGVRGEIEDNSKEGDKSLKDAQNIIIGSNRMALDAARIKAEDLDFHAEILTDTLTGEASDAAKWLAGVCRKRINRPICLISGGETTVSVTGAGRGGRNMELALAFAIEMRGSEGVTLLSAGTDGTDGPTDATGAVVDGGTVERALRLDLNPEEYLTSNDSYNFFKRVGGLLVTGPTGTNVMDVQIMLLT